MAHIYPCKKNTKCIFLVEVNNFHEIEIFDIEFTFLSWKKRLGLLCLL